MERTRYSRRAMSTINRDRALARIRHDLATIVNASPMHIASTTSKRRTGLEQSASLGWANNSDGRDIDADWEILKRDIESLWQPED